MEQRYLGQSDLHVSVVGLGCDNFGLTIEIDAARDVVHAALDAGVTFIDTADAYGRQSSSEIMLGEILGRRRKDVVLATKFGTPLDTPTPTTPPVIGKASRSYVVAALEASLRRLKTDWIDLYQLHWPDPATPIAETLEALDDLIRQGKVRYIGSSNLSARQLTEADETAKRLGLNAFISAQDEYSLLARGVEDERLPTAERLGLAFIPYFPLASGMLTGKYRRGVPQGSRLAKLPMLSPHWMSERNQKIVEELAGFCTARGRTLLELAFSWLAARPGVASVIAGATRPEQIEQNALAVGWKLTAEELAQVDRITR